MKLESSGLVLDIHALFKKGVHELPPEVRLEGNAMQRAVAERLLEQHYSRIRVTDDGTPIRLASLEQHASARLAAVLEGVYPPERTFLLHTIPERLLVAYAERHGIPVACEERSAVREMLERIAEEQPQTFFSLARSLDRLDPD